MKFLFAVAFLCIGAVAAQTTAPTHQNTRHLAEALEKRGEALLERSKKALEELRHSGHWHLASGLEHQTTLVEALVMDLKKQLANKDHQHQMHHIHVIEEDLLHLENQISEEIHIINEVKNHHQHKGHNSNELIAKAEQLVKNAKEQMAKHHGHGHKEDKAIEHEIQSIEKLIKEIQAKPAPADLKKDEEALARHEKSLTQLLEKANHRDHGHGHEHKPHEPHNPHHGH